MGIFESKLAKGNSESKSAKGNSDSKSAMGNSASKSYSFEALSNNRFALLTDDKAKTTDDKAVTAENKPYPDWKERMEKLVIPQKEVGDKMLPVLALWGVDDATDEQRDEMVNVIVQFFEEIRPNKLMISGRRAVEVAKQAELILRKVHGQAKYFPEVFITGCADGVDSVPLRLVGSSDPIPGVTVLGQYTPTPFARADVDGKLNPEPISLSLKAFEGLRPGESPVQKLVTVPESGADFPEFIAKMEGQWEARDTWNAKQADACLAFLTVDEKKGATGHDGTKATLNIFAHGRYAHPPAGTSEWEVGSDGVVQLPSAPNAFVGYKELKRTQ